jgi:hypothetical protein
MSIDVTWCSWSMSSLRTCDEPKACADAPSYGGLTDQQFTYSYGVDKLYNAGEDGRAEV